MGRTWVVFARSVVRAEFLGASRRCTSAAAARSRRARCVVLDSSSPLRVVVGAVASSLGAVAVARRSRRRCMQRRAGAPGTVSVVPPRSRRRGARPLLFRSGGSLHGACAELSGWRSLSAVVGAVASSLEAVAVARRSRRRCLHAALAPLAPAQSCRRVRGGVALGRRFRGGDSLSARTLRSARQLELSARGRWRGRL